MIKKIFFQIVFFNFFFIEKVFTAESGGMPQLNPEFWISQIFWLTITFGILYVILSKLILPKISANLESRKSQISDNIEAADRQREESESKLKEYDEVISKGKIEAKKDILPSKRESIKGY
jgi:F-type H+-transporting ATPase subunit b